MKSPVRWSLATLLVIAAACSPKERAKPLLSKAAAATGAVLVTNVRDVASLRAEAARFHVAIEGEAVLTLRGDPDALSRMTIAGTESPLFAADERVSVERASATTADPEVFFLARKEFGLPEYQRDHPTHDGRGVIVGLIDDGVSPLHEGFRLTSDGQRKYLGHASQSSFLHLGLQEVANGVTANAFTQSLTGDGARVWQGVADETRPLVSSALYTGVANAPRFDLNEDGAYGALALAAVVRDGHAQICVDSNANDRADTAECFGTFAATGEHGTWTADGLATIQAEFDHTTGTLVLSQGERLSDSRGEGVASVMAGHRIGGRFDGLAPGAQLLDYDLSEQSADSGESLYTVGTFVRGFEWLGQNGAEVVNVSYSIFFHSAASQEFARAAFDALVKRYKFAVSFSAGNNGPGLGSLNRRGMYPLDALVAGAYVSKELDEYVHGVTGLPEEGRVVWYSSRGPGPDGGRGPTVISPLASLTYREPGGGYQAFSGTSSASPALAGFTAVLLSAVKQQRLAVDLTALVNAVRLSAAPLPGVPFVEQGAGLPNLTRAVAIYRTLLSGDEFARVDTRVTTLVGPDGIDLRGLLLKASELASSAEHTVRLTGVAAPSVPAVRAAAILKTVKIDYSAPWLTGPGRFWVSVGGSAFPIGIDRASAREALAAGGGEAYGEITVRDDVSNAVLVVVPVTIVDDVSLTARRTARVTLGPEASARVHFHVPAGVSAVRVRAVLDDASSQLVGLRVYDANSVSVASVRGTEGLRDLVIPTPRTGWHQLGFYKAGGTAAEIPVDVVLEPVTLKLATAGLAIGQGKLVIDNGGPAQDVKVQLFPKAPVVQTSYVSSATDGAFYVNVPVTAARAVYTLALTPAEAPALSYAWTDNCTATLMNASGDVISRAVASTVEAPEGEEGRTLAYVCLPFEHAGPGAFLGLTYRAAVSRRTTEPLAVASAVVRLSPGRSQVALTWNAALLPNAGSPLDVRVGPAFSGEPVSIGSIEAF